MVGHFLSAPNLLILLGIEGYFVKRDGNEEGNKVDKG